MTSGTTHRRSGRGSGWPTSTPPGGARHGGRNRRSRQAPTRPHRVQAALRKGLRGDGVAERAIPRSSSTTPSTTGLGPRARRPRSGSPGTRRIAGRGRLLRAAEVGTEVAKDATYAEVESVKAVSDVYAPLSGEVTAVNETLTDSPEQINEDPYGEAAGQGEAVRGPIGGRRADGRGRLQGAARRRLRGPASTAVLSSVSR